MSRSRCLSPRAAALWVTTTLLPLTVNAAAGSTSALPSNPPSILPSALSADCVDYRPYKHFLSELPLEAASSVTMTGDLALVAGGGDLALVDLSDPMSPIETSRLSDVGAARTQVLGNLAYVACGLQGLRIIDVTDPANPLVLSTLVLPGSSIDVSVDGTVACVAVGSGVAVVDVALPVAPTLLSLIPEGHNAVRAVEYIPPACYFQSTTIPPCIVVADLTDPVQPQMVTTLCLLGASNRQNAIRDIAHAAGTLFVVRGYGGSRGLQAINITNPWAPTLLSSLAMPDEPCEVSIAGRYAYISYDDNYADILSGVVCVDIFDPVRPSIVSMAHTPGKTGGLSVSGDVAAVAARYPAALQVFNATALRAPPHLATIAPSETVLPSARSGDLLFLSQAGGLLRILDISSLEAPALLAVTHWPADVTGIAVSGDLLLFTLGASGLRILDITTPSAPQELASTLSGFTLTDLAVSGTLAIVPSLSDSALKVVDFAIPSAPTVLSSHPLPRAAHNPGYCVAASATHVFVSVFDHGLYAVDLADPAAPAIVDSLSIGGTNPALYDLAITGGIACVAERYEGLVLVDVSDPTSMRRVGTAPILGTGAYAASVSGHYAYLEDRLWIGSSVIEVFDIADPANPEHVGDIGLASVAQHLTATEDLLLIGTYQGGLVVAGTQCSGAAVTVLAPDGTPPSVWATPGSREIRWWYTGSEPPSSWQIAYSTDGGLHYRIVDDHLTVSGPPYSYLWSVPPIATTHLRVRVSAVSAAGEVIASDASDHDQVLYNRYGVCFRYYGGLQGPSTSESRAVIRWTTMSGASRYRLTVTQDNSTSCLDWSAGEQVFDNIVGDPPPSYFEIPADVLDSMVAASYRVGVEGYDALGSLIGQYSDDIIVCRLGDLDPLDTEAKDPVLLIHGWTADSAIWYRNNQSPLVTELIGGAGASATKRHPWTFEYPNLGSIDKSGAALGEAIAYVRHLSDKTEVSLIAHSMGGLVSRAYLQSKSTSPRSPFSPYPPFRGDVDRLTTLSTPHLGADGERAAALFKEISLSCVRSLGAPATADLSDDSAFIASLFENTVPESVQYMFTAGTDFFGEDVGRARQRFLEGSCDYRSDATVTVCSATGGRCLGLSTHPYLDVGSATVVYRHYGLSHGRMATPGYSEPGDGARKTASDRLLADVLRFNRFGPDDLPDDDCQKLLPTPVEFECETTPAWLPPGAPLLESVDDLRASSATERTGLLRTEGTSQPLVGANIRVQSIEAPDPTEGIVSLTDQFGRATLNLPPGEYRVQVTAPGTEARTETLTIPNPPTNYLWRLSLDSILGYEGPRNASAVINDGAPSTPDSSVTVSLSCDNASEYQISEYPDFHDAAWQPMTDTALYLFGGTPGLKALYARYRGASGQESGQLVSTVVLAPSLVGSISVASAPTGFGIVLDSHDTGLLTPAVLNDLAPGYHRVSLVAPGMLSSPASSNVEVTAGGSELVGFALIATPAPSPVDLASLGNGDYLSGTPFDWNPAEPEGEGTRFFYNVRVSADTAQTELMWQRLGVAESSVPMPTSVPDSQHCFISIETVNGQGAVQSEPFAVRGFYLDHTAPNVTVLTPAVGDTLAPGEAAVFTSSVGDWSGIARILALLSIDGGATFPDTVYDGAWADTLTWTVPSYGLAESSILRVRALDLAGNVGADDTDSTFVIHDGVTAAETDLPIVTLDLSAALTNPSRRSTSFRLDVPRPTDVEVTVFDVHGRRVKTLVEDHLERGRHLITWKGEDGSGSRVASGVYFVRLKTSEITRTRKVVLLR